MKKNIILFIGFVLGIFIVSCDKVNEPFLEHQGTFYDTISGNDTIPKRVVLIEDYTGHKCVNCPEAAYLAQNIQLASAGQVIIMAVHAGYFAKPDGSGNYTTDFRCNEGEALNTYFGVTANPIGMINRKPYQGKRLLKPEAWQAAVDEQLLLEPSFNIQIKNTYNSSSRQLESKINLKSLKANNGSYKLCVYLLETNIIAPQKNNNASIGTTPDILNYSHKHVLRGSLNGLWGESVFTSATVAVNETAQKTYNYTLPGTFNDSNCSILAFLYRSDEGSEKDVIVQAAEMHLQ